MMIAKWSMRRARTASHALALDPVYDDDRQKQCEVKVGNCNAAGIKAALALVIILLALPVLASQPIYASSQEDARAVLARGRYLVLVAGCNDCHSPGWRESDGRLAQSAWLTGNSVGFRSEWGTIYPTNLRLRFQVMSEEQYNTTVRTRGGPPPMVWQNLRALTPADRHAIYLFIRHLGPAGQPAPRNLSPWEEPTTRYIDMRVRPLSSQARARPSVAP